MRTARPVSRCWSAAGSAARRSSPRPSSRSCHGRDILSYVEAILRVYNQYGRRDNIYKARIKILVHELGIEKFAREVEEEWQQMRDSALTLDDSVIEEIRSRFSYPAYEKLPHMPDELKKAAHDPLSRRWRKQLGGSRTRCRAIRS